VKSAFKIVDKISIEFPYENAEIATRLITVFESAYIYKVRTSIQSIAFNILN
jgi:hypothetical protein